MRVRPRGPSQMSLHSSRLRLPISWANHQGTHMQTIAAIIRAKKGHEATMQRALLAVADHVRINEPTTAGFYIAQDTANPCVFTTYDRFADKAVMARHNASG